MNIVMMALVVGVLFATGTYLILRRRPIRLILGLGLLGHGVNLLLFSLGGSERGLPPIVVDKAAFTGDISGFVDPLPQALILTAIVIGFGVMAFTVVLVNRRHALAADVEADVPVVESEKVVDPFAPLEHEKGGLDLEPDDYEWLEYSVSEELQRARQRIQARAAADAAANLTDEPTDAPTSNPKEGSV
ncbi:MAG: NADH-quinone oxidoreductase subunit K [Caldilineaceae bacterium]